MESNNYSQNNNLNSNTISNINRIYESNGKDKQSWENLLISVYQFQSYQDLLSYLVQKIKNEPSNDLNLDIIDYFVDYGPNELIREISSIDFMNHIYNLMKKSSGSGLEVQKKGIYLTKKWYDKANMDNNGNYEGFINNYMELKKNGICFPPSEYKLFTYELNFSEMEAKIAKSKAEQNQRNNNNINMNNINNNDNTNQMNNNNFNNNKFEENQFNENDDVPNLDNFFNNLKTNNRDNLNQKDNGFPKIEDDEDEVDEDNKYYTNERYSGN